MLVRPFSYSLRPLRFSLRAPRHRRWVSGLKLSETGQRDALLHSLLQRTYQEHKGLVSVLSLPKGLRWLTGSSPHLFVRNCDKDLFDIIHKRYQEGSPGAILTGNPGIGKSWFLSYCLLRFAQQGQSVYYQSAGENLAWLFRPDGLVRLFEAPATVPAEIRDSPSSTVYLFDPSGPFPAEPIATHCFTLVAAPPERKHYHSFAKRIDNFKLYQPVWSWEELECVLGYLPGMGKEGVRGRYEKYGGIPRYVFSAGDNWRMDLESALVLGQLEGIGKSLAGLEHVNEIFHMLLQFEIGGDYRRYKVKLASPYVQRRLETSQVYPIDRNSFYLSESA
eukprot:TRINITY_DN20481_c0_g1_i1.p1 TRINITY_DN20481_c0_g1~~TRINITY_DN20481_c0_g1_i1.p1  ORF type:complete len:343 (-),score=49.68 TRINITY_DN20481_c0_g1_i1:50-1051(-)